MNIEDKTSLIELMEKRFPEIVDKVTEGRYELKNADNDSIGYDKTSDEFIKGFYIWDKTQNVEIGKAYYQLSYKFLLTHVCPNDRLNEKVEPIKEREDYLNKIRQYLSSEFSGEIDRFDKQESKIYFK